MPAPRGDKWETDIEARIRKVEQRNPLAGTGTTPIDIGQLLLSGSITIPSNGLLLVDGGDVVMLDKAPSATELFRMGEQVNGDRGITIRRIDGSAALDVRDLFGNGYQTVRLYDKAGGAIVSDAALALHGLDAPHIPIPFVPSSFASTTFAQTTASAAFVPLFESSAFFNNPYMRLKIKAQCSDATTAAEVGVWDTVAGAFLVEPFTLASTQIIIPAGTTTVTEFEADKLMTLPGPMSNEMKLEVRAKVTAGTGSVSVAVTRAIGHS